MSKYLKLLLGLGLFLISAAPTIAKIAPTSENHYYSYSVKEDGSANVWLRIDELQTDTKDRKYPLELPKGAKSGAKAWYRENGGGCIYPYLMEGGGGGTPAVESEMRYEERYPCKLEYNQWKEAEVKQNENKLSITIPKSKVINNQNNRTLSLGITWKIKNVSYKKWWGREIKIETPKSENFIPYVSVGIDLPAGVYIRDKQSPPANWEEFIGSKAVVSMESRGIGDMDSQAFSPVMFDSAGGGQIFKDKSNLQPGESFSFMLMTATSNWKLYIKEIGLMFVGVLILILVAALLLRLIIGRKPFWWYIAVIMLLAVFIGIITWMIIMYKSLFYGYPMPGTTVNLNEGME